MTEKKTVTKKTEAKVTHQKKAAPKVQKTKSEKYLASRLKLDIPIIPTKGRTKASKRPEKKFDIPGAQTFSDEDVKNVLYYMGWQCCTLKAACAAAGLNYHAVWQRINNSDALRNLDRNARNLYLRGAVRDMNVIATEVDDPNRARLMCDNLKWEASRVLRHEFGDHVIVSGDKNAPLMTKLVIGADEIVKKLNSRELKEVKEDE